MVWVCASSSNASTHIEHVRPLRTYIDVQARRLSHELDEHFCLGRPNSPGAYMLCLSIPAIGLSVALKAKFGLSAASCRHVEAGEDVAETPIDLAVSRIERGLLP